jgi:hypothetical protein
MIVKTSELTGAALDWAVCMANGLKPEDIYISKGHTTSLFRRLRDEDGRLDGRYMTGPDLLFSRKWESAGPIIEREGINLRRMVGASCAAYIDEGGSSKFSVKFRMVGETALTAAMRCYVASKLGDEVDVPKELL